MLVANGGQGPITLGVMSLHRFSNFAIPKSLDFSGTTKARKLKVCIYMGIDLDVMCKPELGSRIYKSWKLCLLVGFQKIKMHFAQ